MSLPRIVSRDEWLVERRELLGADEAMTRARDDLNNQAAQAAEGRLLLGRVVA